MNQRNPHHAIDGGAPTDPAHGPLPTPADRDAIDALIESAMDPTRVAPVHRERAGVVAKLLSVLNARVRNDRLLVDIALARALRAEAAPTGVEPSLIPADEEALDAWMLAGYDANRVPTSLKERARRHEAIARMITTAPAAASASSLVDRTLASVARAEADRSDRLRIAPERVRSAPRFRIHDLVSVAAMLLIGAAVALPILAKTRAYARQTLCQANLGSTAVAMASYAASNRDALPMSTAGLGGGTWWNVGSESTPSNSSNLYTLFRNGYVGLDDLACPGNPEAAVDPAETAGFDWRRIEQVSYSYQVYPRSGVPTIHENPSRVVLADRSPVILLAIRRQQIDPVADSPNHNGRGQHILRGDGSTEWLTSPVLEDSGDNIWLPLAVENRIRQIESERRGAKAPKVEPIKGNERPETPHDVFLGP